MKYLDYSVNDRGQLVFTPGCSGCGGQLSGFENFCPHCGKKLVRKMHTFNKGSILTIVNEAPLEHTMWSGGTPLKTAWDVKADTVESAAAAGMRTDDSEKTAVAQSGGGRCPCGRSTSEGCEFCSENGACTRTVLTSYPPQYIRCPFHGDGYMFCSEA